MEKTPRNVIVFLFVLLFADLCIHSQSLHFRHYTTHRGLTDDFVQCIFQDGNGYLWFGTEKGLSRFDGLEFLNFSGDNILPFNNIYAICQGPSGKIWFSYYTEGIGVISPEGIIHYTEDDGLPHNQVHHFFLDSRKNLWIATAKGLSIFDGKRFKTFTTVHGLPSDFVDCVEADRDGRIWAGTSEGPVLYDGSNFVKHSYARQLEKKRILRMLFDSRKRAWFGTNNGLYMFENGELKCFDMRHGLGAPSINGLLEDANGKIWAATPNGLGRYDGDGFSRFTTRNGLLDNYICDLHTDHEGNKWIATAKGISRLNSENIVCYTTKDGLPVDSVTCIDEDKKGLYWIGTSTGLARLEHGRLKVYTTRDGLPGNYICSLDVSRDDAVWIATLGGVSRFKNGRFTNFTRREGLLRKSVYEICQDGKGTVWIGMPDCVQQIENQVVLPLLPGIPKFRVLHILDDRQGNIWFASTDGLYQYDRRTFFRFTKQDGLPDNIINFLFRDSHGKLWIATEFGLSCFHNRQFKNYTNKDGLPTNYCTFVMEDDGKNIWIGTANGLSCFDGTHFKNYTLENHDLISKAWETGFKDSNGKLWFGSNNGIMCFSPPPFSVNTTPPPIHLTRVNVLEDEIPLNAGEDIQLRHDQNYLHFSYTGISFISPQNLSYRYRIKGLEHGWKTTANRSMFYPYLPPGQYTFFVKAVNSDGYESTTPASVQFEILPPYWETWWFRALLVVSGSTLMGMFFFFRFRRAREKEILNAQQRELEAKNQQLIMSQRMELLGTMAAGAVHDLKNLLAVILGYSRIASRTRGKKNEQPDPSIAHIESTANSAVHVVSQILAFTRQQYQTALDVNLPDLIDETLEILNVSKPDHIDIQWQRPEEPILININPTRFQQVVMNLCLNAFHAMPQDGVLELTMDKTSGEVIVMTVSDSGEGIPQDILPHIFEPMFTTKSQKEGTGLGLFVVEQIIEQYGGSIDVQSVPGQGTIFAVTLCP